MKRPELADKYGHVWNDIAETREKMREVAPDLYALRSGGLGISEYYSRAAQLVMLADELGKPEAERDDAFKGERLEVMKRALSKGIDVGYDMDRLTLENQLKMMRHLLGADDPVLQVLLQGRTPENAAADLLKATVLRDSTRIAALVDGAPSAILTSNDPLIAAARLAAPRYDHARNIARETSASDQVNRSLLGRALFDVYGTDIPPDATFSLRIADGVVKGYEYNGTKAPPHTTFYGLYNRHYSFEGEEAWELPQRWLNPPQEFDMSTPMDFVSTCDIIGGNSGSPIINKNREVVGLVFDGNIESLPGDFIFAEDMGNRTVSVHSAGILEAVQYILKADRVARELERGSLPNLR